MKIHFYLRYATQYGQALFVQLNQSDTPLPMEYIDERFWHAVIDLGKTAPETLGYGYLMRDKNGENKQEWDNTRALDLLDLQAHTLQVIDHWNETGAVENVFFTQPFEEIYLKKEGEPAAKKPAQYTHVFKVKAPRLEPGEVVCLLGHGVGLRSWDSAAPLLLRREGSWWVCRLDLEKEEFPLGYKYGVWNTRTNKFRRFEAGTNRSLYAFPTGGAGKVVLHDGFVHVPVPAWRGAGVAIPVFSLRSQNSFGVGEFSDLPLLADWAAATGLKLLQLLPVNDTSATWAGVQNTGPDRPFWTDSYPYAAISAFALHPIYLNLAEVAGKKHAAVLKPYAKQQKKLNALDVVDYEAVVRAKWEMIHLLFPLLKEEWRKDPAYLAYFEEHKHWLAPYAAFCYLRDTYGGTDFNQWPEHQTFDARAVAQRFAPETAGHDEMAVHCFVQWRLHLQLKAAVEYAHSRGLGLKGDIPIGIYRYSCDAWVAPELYNMDAQAGAPPDDFAEKGQNWGFPTYNWARMKEDGFSWWKQRFSQMKLYFDAFRIDHILGFFRIWSIPLNAVEGIMGHFVPAIPVAEHEFLEAGVGFNAGRLCEPFIIDPVLQEMFREETAAVKAHFLEILPETGQYRFKAAFDTQRKVEAYISSPEGATWGSVLAGLLNLLSNVILFKDPAGKGYHFRFGIEKTSSFNYLPEEAKSRLKDLYVNYFFRRQDEFWQREAMEKLPALKRSTNMLICGEDLGMVLHCVPHVMRELGILSLEIQRMPKASGATFFHPKDAPYLAVVTPSTHDMSTIRGWWEEDRHLSQRFFNEVLHIEGNAPYFCEPWLNQAILAQHFQSPAMWAIFQIQDLMGMDTALRGKHPEEERINVPANPKHYWRYRMPLSLEDLMQQDGFNKAVRDLVEQSGRV